MIKLEKIIDSLYSDNFVNYQINESYSSHWNEYTKKLVVKKKENNFDIQSYGLATFIDKNLFSIIKSIPRKFFLFYLFIKFINERKIFNKISIISNQTKKLIEFDQIKHGIILKILKNHINFENNNKYICIIGDGHGFFGSLIKKYYPNSKIIFVNLGRNLFLDAYYVNKCFNDLSSLLLNENNILQINNQDFIFLDSSKYELISKLPVFLFINIASMQEMNNKTITSYFKYMRKNPNAEFFYCCNRVHKILPDSSNIIFDNYPWLKEDKILVEEICNWYKKYPISRYPFLKRFDGPIKHKLIRFSNANDK